jgi:hypothetical protein
MWRISRAKTADAGAIRPSLTEPAGSSIAAVELALTITGEAARQQTVAQSRLPSSSPQEAAHSRAEPNAT